MVKTQTHKIIAFALLTVIIAVISFAAVIKLIHSKTIFSLSKEDYAVIVSLDSSKIFSTEKRTFWFNPFKFRVYKYPQQYQYTLCTTSSTNQGRLITVKYEALFSLPENNEQRCNVYRIYKSWKNLRKVLQRKADKKVALLTEDKPMAFIEEVCNGYYFPVHDQDLEKLGIKWEMKMKLNPRSI